MYKKPYVKPNKVFAGIGNRDTPFAFIDLIVEVSRRLSKAGYTLRTGAAHGADKAFMSGTMRCELYVPWNNYEGIEQKYSPPKEAERLAEHFNQHWKNKFITRGIRALHARNMMIVAGPHLDAPVDFVACFTRDGCEGIAMRSAETGVTGSAIAYADSLGIPIINFANKGSLQRLQELTSVDFSDLVLPSLVVPFP